MSQMYKLSVKQWNPFVGCRFDCIYCKSSFRQQLKRWAKKNCQKCYNYEPHEHPERLNQHLPKTGYMQFIFACACGDIAFATPEYVQNIADKMAQWPDRTFLLQSKDPQCFQTIKFPKNVILGTTIETNYSRMFSKSGAIEYRKISKAPVPIKRYEYLAQLSHPFKMITIEPILDFWSSRLLMLIEQIRPCMVWVGYDSGHNNLPEPPLWKVRDLIWEVQKAGIVVLLKMMKNE